MALSLRGVKTRYELKEVIARGGMGVVYKAYDKVMKRPVALKTLLDVRDGNALKLFHKECEDLASLTHPNIVSIFDVGEFEDEDGQKPYLVMELLPGQTLDKLIRGSSARLTVERSIDIFSQTCRGLFAAHERGLIHRDLKPSNIFVMEDDSVKIIDFGVAHRLDSNLTVGRKGTLLYMSPEQLLMKALTPASDIFSLGVVCYETLARRRPFERSIEEDVAEAIQHESPPPVHELNPAVDVVISQAIHKAMAKDPLHRYKSAREFGDTLQKALHKEPIEIFNPARIRPRLERARGAYDKGDFEYASEILTELESEGHLDPEVAGLRGDIDQARLERRVQQLIETARTRMDEQEFQIALQKIEEALQLDPKNTEALSLKAKVNSRRTDQDVEGWYDIARTHMENRAFGPAREALRRILELRPREPKASQLLSEVERVELSQQRARDQKEGMYRAAMEAERRGDISSALSKLERVLEIEKEAPEPARTGTYQRLYDKVRSEYESIKGARAEAKRLLDDGKFAPALALCNEYLIKYPGDTLFQALKFDIEEKHRQSVSARIAETDRAVEAEPDLDRRVSIIEQAARENPGEAHFERALQNARDKRDMVNKIVEEARTLEERGQFGEAFAKWETLQTIYSRYPGLQIEIGRLNKRREQTRLQDAKARWVEQIERQREAGDFVRAGELARMAGQEFPGDPEFQELDRLAQQALERRAEAERLLGLGREACAAGRTAEGIETFRRAYDLDSSNSQVRTVLVETLIEQGRVLMESNPGSAEELFNHALELEPNHALATGLLRLVADQRKVEIIDSALATARRLEGAGDLKTAMEAIADALATYPREQRLLQVQNSLRRSTQELRRKDLEQAKRLARDTGTLDQQRRTQYAEQLDRYMTVYGEDEEFRTVVEDARRRFETAFTTSDETVVMSRAAAASASGATQSETPTVILPSPAAPSVKKANRETLKDRLSKAALTTPWSRRTTLVATSSALGLILLAAIGAHYFPKSRRQVKPIAAQGSLPISTVPSGAILYIDGQPEGTITNPVTIQRSPGTYTLEARRTGYQPLEQKLEIRSGSMPPITIQLVPELPTLRIVGSGQVFVDADPAAEITEGQFERQLPTGEHTVRIVMNRASETSFKVRVDPDGLPVVSELKANEVTPLILSNFGKQAKIYGANATPIPVQLKGQNIGNLGAGGLDLPALEPSIYELVMGDGKKRNIDIGPNRTLSVLLEADPNEGYLLVQTNEDDATVVLTSNGKEYGRKATQNHQARFAHLRVRNYTVQVTKDGFDAGQPQSIDVAKGQQATLSFDLKHQTRPGAILVKSVPGAQILLDGRGIGPATSDGSLLLPNVAQGQHHLEARLKRYQVGSAQLTVGDGETKTVELSLKLAPGTVQIQRDPSNATVTYHKSGETTEQTATENSLALPEGTYEFSAKAPDYQARTNITVQVRAEETTTADLRLSTLLKSEPKVHEDAMETLWPKGQWSLPETNGWLLHKGDAFLGVTRSGPAIISFDAPLSGVVRSRLIWATNYINPQHYVQYELHDTNLTIKVMGEKENRPAKPVKKGSFYRIRLDWRADSITVNINNEVVDELKGDFSQGKFGFLKNGEVRMQNFRVE